VLGALRDTQIHTASGATNLLAEIDTISGASGGSFPAAYYGLYGDDIFESFEGRFLRRNIQGGIVWRALLPWNLVMLLTPWLSRSDIAKGIYDKSVFDHATFRSLGEAKGPLIYINATDLSSGHRFTFTQSQFDVICSDLEPFPIAYAVAASSAVPMLLSPVTIRNYAGTCDLLLPEWLEEALQNRRTNPRQYRVARAFVDFRDSGKRYFHLVDGGISDNLGLRAGLDTVAVAGGVLQTAEIMDVDLPDHLVIISVNAETDPDPTIDLSSAAPGFTSMMNAVSGAQIRRYNLETLLLADAMLQEMARDAARIGHDMKVYMVEVSFDNIQDAKRRRYLKRIPTSFKLSDEQVDDLIQAGRELIVAEPQFQELLMNLDGDLPPAESSSSPDAVRDGS
jgi:NTE family protein